MEWSTPSGVLGQSYFIFGVILSELEGPAVILRKNGCSGKSRSLDSVGHGRPPALGMALHKHALPSAPEQVELGGHHAKNRTHAAGSTCNLQR
jgi:hypothetical protein